MSVLSDIETTLCETDLFVINKQLKAALTRISELSEELNATRIDLRLVKDELCYVKKTNANLVRHFDRYSVKVDDIKEKLEYFEALAYD